MPKSRLAPVAAILSVVVFVTWLHLTQPERRTASAAPAVAEAAVVDEPDPMPRNGAGSAVPCAIPLAWRMANVDSRFGLSPEQAVAVVRKAVAAWEKAVGQSLFAEDTLAGLPIRLVYDERQAGSSQRTRLETNLAQIDDGLRDESRVLESRRQAYEERRVEYQGQADAYEEASSLHADSVKAYNMTGSGGITTGGELRAAQQRLDRQHGDLLAIGADLEEQRLALRDDAADLNRRIDEHRVRVADLTKTLSPSQVESGTYRELVERAGGQNVAVRRAIDVYEFDGSDELWLVVAHELGHALGLGHASVPGAVMSEAHLRTRKIIMAIQPPDLELLRERCPSL